MPNRQKGVCRFLWNGCSLLMVPLVVLCVRFLDIPLAAYVNRRLFANAHWSRLSADLPDLLLLVVLLTTLSAVALYQMRTRRGIFDSTTRFAELTAWAAPASYLVKSALKLAFGRVNTRTWLLDPALNGFHWFQRRQGCEGFPSGHMMVTVTLLAALWRFHPASRPWGLLLTLLLGVALIATDYHFLSDVLAGAYLGALVEVVAFSILKRRKRQGDSPGR